MKRDEKVTVLITAESIIAGFMIAYGALNGQLLTYWSGHHASLLTTYLAGVGIYAIVLTCFVSIVLLFNSVDAWSKPGTFAAGLDLFLLAILGSAVFTVSNVFSIFDFTVSAKHRPISCIPVMPLASISKWLFIVYGAILLMVLLLTARTDLLRSLEGTHRLFWCLVVGVVIVACVTVALCVPLSCFYQMVGLPPNFSTSFLMN